MQHDSDTTPEATGAKKEPPYPALRVVVDIRLDESGATVVMPTIYTKPSQEHPDRQATVEALSGPVRDAAMELGRQIVTIVTGETTPLEAEIEPMGPPPKRDGRAGRA